MSDHELPVNRTSADHLYSIAKAGLGSLPVVGAAAEELLAIIVTPSIEKRRNDWLRSLGERLRILETAGFLRLEDLNTNELFLDVAMQATAAALRTASEEKRISLQAAVLNSTQPTQSLKETQRVIFVTLIDRFTEWHLRLLRLFHDPPAVFRERGKPMPASLGGVSGVVVQPIYPELLQDRALFDLIWKDLHESGLVNGSAHAMVSRPYDSATTATGKDFIAFVTLPPQLREETSQLSA